MGFPQPAANSRQPSLEELRGLLRRCHCQGERTRAELARRLHDDLIQKLTVVSLELSLADGSMAGEKPRSVEDLQARLKELSPLVKQMIAGVRQIQTELRPRLLDEFGLVAALQSECQALEKKSGLSFKVVAQPEAIALEKPLAAELFRIFQQIARNIEQHAGAHQVVVAAEAQGKWFGLTVTDDGKGMAPEQLADSRALGLLELRERARALGGGVVIESRPGHGTTVIVSVPLKLAAARSEE